MDEGYIIEKNGYVYFKKIKRKPSPLADFEVMYGAYSRELNPSLDVYDLIGNSGSRILYEKDNLLMKWIYQKKSGEHKKENGIISLLSAKHPSLNPMENQMEMASYDVKKGRIHKINVYRPAMFLEEFQKHKDMPFHEYIKGFLKFD